MLTVFSEETQDQLQEKESWVWHKTASDGVAPVLEIWEMCHSLPLLPDSLCLWEVVTDRILSIHQIDLFKNYGPQVKRKDVLRNNYSKNVSMKIQ